jgi:hypothetical protein
MCASVVVSIVQECAKGDRKVCSECESIVWLLSRCVLGGIEVSTVSVRVFLWVLCRNVLGETEVYCECVSVVVSTVQECAWGDRSVLWVCECVCDYCAGMCLGRQKCLLWVCECGCEYSAGMCLGRQKRLQCIWTTLKTISLLGHQQTKLQGLFAVRHSLLSFLCVVPFWFSVSHTQQTFLHTTHCDCPHSSNCSTPTYLASSNMQDIDWITCCITCEKSNPITGLDRPQELQEVEAPIFQDNRHMKLVRLSVLRTGRL